MNQSGGHIWLKLSRFFISLVGIITVASPLSAAALTTSSIKPTTGPTTGGTKVMIQGEGFEKQVREKFKDVAAGVEHALLLSESGHVWTVGRNTFGQLGFNSVKGYTTKPQDITDSLDLSSSDEITKVVAGDYYSFAISKNHRVFAWGDNQWGQLGNGSVMNQFEPVEITNQFPLDADDYIADVVAGVQTSYAVSHKGIGFYWGNGNDDLDGDNDRDYERTPIPTPTRSNWAGALAHFKVVAGNRVAASMTAGDLLFTWGRNTNGELGRTKYGEPNQLSKSETPWFISCRANSNISWGKASEDDKNQCDNFDLSEDDRMIDVDAGNGVMAVVTFDGSVFVWGSNQNKMLGIPKGDKANPFDAQTGADMTSTPIDLTNYTDSTNAQASEGRNLFDEVGLAAGDRIKQISVGNSSVLAVSDTGEVFSWGSNANGQLGVGNYDAVDGIENITDQFNLPEGVIIDKVVAGGNASALESNHSFAIDSEGNVYSWGGDSSLRPGINSIAKVPTPFKISDRLTASVSNVASVFFGDVEASDFDVLSDTIIMATAPTVDAPIEATISVVDKDSHQADAATSYAYTEPKAPVTPDDPDNPSGGDEPTDPDNPADPNNPSGNNTTTTDNNKTTTTDDTAKQTANDKLADLMKQLGVNSTSDLQKLLTSGSDASSDSYIKAPNTAASFN